MEKHNFGVKPVTCHSLSGDGNGMAMSLNDNDVKIYKKVGNKWSETDTLGEHGQNVTGIDWAPKSNRIVTCGAVSFFQSIILLVSVSPWKLYGLIPSTLQIVEINLLS